MNLAVYDLKLATESMKESGKCAAKKMSSVYP